MSDKKKGSLTSEEKTEPVSEGTDATATEDRITKLESLIADLATSNEETKKENKRLSKIEERFDRLVEISETAQKESSDLREENLSLRSGLEALTAINENRRKTLDEIDETSQAFYDKLMSDNAEIVRQMRKTKKGRKLGTKHWQYRVKVEGKFLPNWKSMYCDGETEAEAILALRTRFPKTNYVEGEVAFWPVWKHGHTAQVEQNLRDERRKVDQDLEAFA